MEKILQGKIPKTDYYESGKTIFKGWLIYVFIIFLFMILSIVFSSTSNKQIVMDTAEIEDIVFLLVNEERSRAGELRLEFSLDLYILALGHSRRMMEEDFFEHSEYNVGENIAETPIGDVLGCGLTITNESLATCMVEGWKTSEGHYENMIDPEYTASAVASYCNTKFCRTTQMFV